MTEFEKLVIDYSNFESKFDPFGYDDAFDYPEDAIEIIWNALTDPDFVHQTIERLEEIAEEYDDYAEDAMSLANRMKKIGGME